MKLVLVLAVLAQFATPSSEPTVSPWSASSSVPRGGGSVGTLPSAAGTEAVHGSATWYRYHQGQAAAGPGLRAFLGRHWRGQRVRVCHDRRCITTRLTDFCACPHGDRLVDLDVRDFAKLAPIGAGVIPVSVSRVGLARLPDTSTEEKP